MNKQQFFNSMNYMRVKPAVIDGRITFSGGSSLRKALDELPELEAEMILREAVHNSDLMDVIQERACIRWAEGYSDSLYMAVLSNIVSTSEGGEYNDTPDEAQATFLRSMGVSEADIINRDKHPSVWIKQKPRTDWEAELSNCR